VENQEHQGLQVHKVSPDLEVSGVKPVRLDNEVNQEAQDHKDPPVNLETPDPEANAENLERGEHLVNLEPMDNLAREENLDFQDHPVL